MTIELAPHHMLIITGLLGNHPLERLAEVPQFSWLLQYGKPWLRSAAEENREGPMLQKPQKTRDESIGGTRDDYPIIKDYISKRS
ncbi:MAG: hypothetical protein C4B57_06490 [Deltaproteobacteria bacterium]|nr:MAG: hypothetical protein C4B57_06490 [Deltaproteobacteria bacterium]